MKTKKMELEVLGEEVNATIIKMPLRKYPGILIQGDSLHNVLSLVRNAEADLAAGNAEEALDTLQEIRELISVYHSAYKEALIQNGMPLPFCE